MSDREIVLRALSMGDVTTARAYEEYLAEVNHDMVASYVEWAAAWHGAIAVSVPQNVAAVLTDMVRQKWEESLSGGRDHEATLMVREAIDAIADGDDLAASVEALLTEQGRPLAAFLHGLDQGDLDRPCSVFDAYAFIVRTQHDLLVRYISALVSSATEVLGQPRAEEMMQSTLSSCTYYEPFWKMIEGLTPWDLVNAIAEEFRAHFSGPGREGAVQVIEEADRYRIVLDPCGSGGALRRDPSAPGMFLSITSPATWGRAGQVPAYCAHCAQNELTSVRRLGYPAWVTEFDPDPSRPCGWTVYKDPSAIPDRYLKRLGGSSVVRQSPASLDADSGTEAIGGGPPKEM
jgi:hypothetical protein